MTREQPYSAPPFEDCKFAYDLYTGRYVIPEGFGSPINGAIYHVWTDDDLMVHNGLAKEKMENNKRNNVLSENWSKHGPLQGNAEGYQGEHHISDALGLPRSLKTDFPDTGWDIVFRDLKLSVRNRRYRDDKANLTSRVDKLKWARECDWAILVRVYEDPIPGTSSHLTVIGGVVSCEDFLAKSRKGNLGYAEIKLLDNKHLISWYEWLKEVTGLDLHD